MVHLFSVFHGDVITPKFGSYRADMTIRRTALIANQNSCITFNTYIVRSVICVFIIIDAYLTATVGLYRELLKRMSVVEISNRPFSCLFCFENFFSRKTLQNAVSNTYIYFNQLVGINYVMLVYIYRDGRISD